jgi:hypothetical protein
MRDVGHLLHCKTLDTCLLTHEACALLLDKYLFAFAQATQCSAMIVYGLIYHGCLLSAGSKFTPKCVRGAFSYEPVQQRLMTVKLGWNLLSEFGLRNHPTLACVRAGARILGDFGATVALRAEVVECTKSHVPSRGINFAVASEALDFFALAVTLLRTVQCSAMPSSSPAPEDIISEIQVLPNSSHLKFKTFVLGLLKPFMPE